MKNYKNFLNESIADFMVTLVNSDSKTIDGFIETGGDVNLVADDNSLLMMACETGYLNVIDKLIDNDKIDVNYKNKYGENALYIALVNNWLAVTKSLIKSKKLDINEKVNGENMIIAIARWSNNENVFTFLRLYPDIDWEEKNSDDEYFFNHLNDDGIKRLEMDYPEIYSVYKKEKSIKQFNI